jgi:hypothetical protein
MMELSYRRHRFPPVVIQHAVWLYLRFKLRHGVKWHDGKPFTAADVIVGGRNSIASLRKLGSRRCMA